MFILTLKSQNILTLPPTFLKVMEYLNVHNFKTRKLLAPLSEDHKINIMRVICGIFPTVGHLHTCWCPCSEISRSITNSAII